MYIEIAQFLEVYMNAYLYPNFEAERIRKGLSQSELVEKIGCCRKSYLNWIKKGNIPTSMLIKFAEFYDVSIDYLLNTKGASNERPNICNAH